MCMRFTHRQSLGSGGDAGVVSVRRCQKPLLCPTEPGPVGSEEEDPQPTEAKPISNAGSTWSYSPVHSAVFWTSKTDFFQSPSVYFKTEINTSLSHTATPTISRESLLTLKFNQRSRNQKLERAIHFPRVPNHCKTSYCAGKAKQAVGVSKPPCAPNSVLPASSHNYNKNNTHSNWMEIYTWSLPKPASSPTEQNPLLFFVWTILTGCQNTLLASMLLQPRSCTSTSALRWHF